MYGTQDQLPITGRTYPDELLIKGLQSAYDLLLLMRDAHAQMRRTPDDVEPPLFSYEVLSDDHAKSGTIFSRNLWSHRVSAHSEDFTDQEAVATIFRITRGNMRLIERLMMQVEHILVANQLAVVTKEVVETARENLIIGLSY